MLYKHNPTQSKEQQTNINWLQECKGPKQEIDVKELGKTGGWQQFHFEESSWILTIFYPMEMLEPTHTKVGIQGITAAPPLTVKNSDNPSILQE